jgi:pimeloyl-ACP methyl ester carboxylesterase
MESPPVSYVRTEDGYNVAYTITGQGRPFVFMPWPFSHRGLWWKTAFGRPVAEALAQRFRLVQYDSRGQGMSTRGLPEYHSVEDYVQDLEAVMDRLVVDRAVLYGGPTFCYAAVLYATKHPERVAALILGDVTLGGSFSRAGEGESSFELLARKDWDLFLHTFVSAFSLQGAPTELPYWRDAIDQQDWLRMIAGARKFDLTPHLPRVQAPTLILQNRRLGPDQPVTELAEQGQAVAALIPNSRLLLFDGWASIWYSKGPEPPQAVLAIEDFLRDLGLLDEDGHRAPSQPPEATISTPGRPLSQREVEILRLIAVGRSNQEIAADLVLSVRTVERHITNLYAKIGARRKADATAYALRNGLT